MKKYVLVLGMMMLLGGCQNKTEDFKGIAVVQPTINGGSVSGVILFEKVNEGLSIKGTISNLTPGEHGFHIHQFGDLSAPDGTSAGGHYNPENNEHSGPEGDERHVGDLGNILADENGIAVIDIVDKKACLKGKHSILGRAVVLHAGSDDLKSQPSGAAGKRVGIGVIGIAKQ